MLRAVVASALLAESASLCKNYFEPDSPVTMESEMVTVSV